MKPLKFHSPQFALGLALLLLSQVMPAQVLALNPSPSSRSAAQGPQVPQPPARAQAREHSQLKAALLEHYSELGSLEPWQERLWQEEVLPQALRFIKDYRALPSGLQADVDVQSIRHFLKFYAPRAFSGGGVNQPKLLVYLNTDSQCKKCTESLPQIKAYVNNVLDNRGFQPVWLTDSEMLVGTPGPKVLEDRLSALCRQKKERAGIIVTFTPAPSEEIDTAHADEPRYLIDLVMSLRGVSQIQRKKEILGNESFIQSVTQLMTDIFTELGSVWDQRKLADLDSDSDEVLIEIEGTRDFEQYSKIKNELTEQLKPFGALSDRAISKQNMTLVLFTDTKKDEIQRVVLQSKARWDASHRFQVSVH